MKRDHRLFLKDIVTACEDIQDFIKGMQFSEFLHDKKTTSAVVRQFEIIGEAAKHFPEKRRETYPDIPWKDIAGMRDRLIHAYFGIDYQLVWDTIETKVPALKASIEQILREMDASED